MRAAATTSVAELIEVVVAELRRLKHEPLPADELRRAKDHLKGSLMLNLESTSSRMSHHARQEIYRDPPDSLDEMLAAIERVSDRRRAAAGRSSCSAADSLARDRARQRQRPRADAGAAADRLDVTRGNRPPGEPRHDSALHASRDGPHLERGAPLRDLAGGRDRGRPRHGRRRTSSRPRRRATCERTGRVRHRAHRRDRTDHPARRHRVHDGGRRARRAVRPLAAFRPDLVRRRGHGAGAADARRLRSDPRAISPRCQRPSRRARSSIAAR